MPISEMRGCGGDLWVAPHQFVGKGEGFQLYTDVPRGAKDAQSVAFLNQFRQEVATHLFSPGSPDCTAEIHLLREDKNYFAAANHFQVRTDYGFFIRPVLRHPILIVREESGLGTLTHQMSENLSLSGFDYDTVYLTQLRTAISLHPS